MSSVFVVNFHVQSSTGNEFGGSHLKVAKNFYFRVRDWVFTRGHSTGDGVEVEECGESGNEGQEVEKG